MRKCAGVFWLIQKIYRRRTWKERESKGVFRTWSWKAVWKKSGSISAAEASDIHSGHGQRLFVHYLEGPGVLDALRGKEAWDLYQVICKAGRNRGGVSQITGENPGQHSNYLQSMQKQWPGGSELPTKA